MKAMVQDTHIDTNMHLQMTKNIQVGSKWYRLSTLGYMYEAVITHATASHVTYNTYNEYGSGTYRVTVAQFVAKWC